MNRTIFLLLGFAAMSALCGCSGDTTTETDFDPPGDAGTTTDPLPENDGETPDALCEPANACEVRWVNEVGECMTEIVPGCSVCTTETGAPGTSRDNGECCSGCWAGPTCRQPGDLACGAAGNLCEPCDGVEMCVDGRCQLGVY